jgi:hypothetical protein
LLRYWSLSALGRLEDRSQLAYEIDARLSFLFLRRRLVDQERLDRSHESSLRWNESRAFSQNGEDGVIREILRRIGVMDRYFVEIGASDASQNCTRALAEDGWSGLWIEADGGDVARARQVAGSGVSVLQSRASRENVVSLLRSNGAPSEPDVLVVDIDGDELGVLRASLSSFRPRLVVSEYNAVFRPGVTWAIDPAKVSRWDGTFRHGASLQALCDVLRPLGYLLAYCESSGVNCFFVRADLCGGDFDPPLGDLRALYRVPAFSNHPFGHPRSRRAGAPMNPINTEQLGAITIRDLKLAKGQAQSVVPEAMVRLAVTVENQSSALLSSGGPNAFHLSPRWLDGDGTVPPDAPRLSLPRPVPPHSRARVHLWVRAPDGRGRQRLRVTALCEQVSWREHLGGTGAWADVDIEVRAR